MADKSKIEWTDASWNPITGCSIKSPGCARCYAMKLAGTRLRNHPSRKGLTQDSKTGPVWTGEVRFNEQWLTQPLQWKRPRRIFVCAHGDLFHENVPDAWIDQVFAVMALARQHTFQVLTKRADRMRRYLSDDDAVERIAIAAHKLWAAKLAPASTGNLLIEVIRDDAELKHVTETLRHWPLPNVWLGVSAERQREADERIPELLATPAAVRFVSAEPLLGALDFATPLYRGEAGVTMRGYLRDYAEPDDFHHHATKLNWVIAGGESGPHARPMHPHWVQGLRDQCQAAGVPFFFKQWGEFHPSDQHEPDTEARKRTPETIHFDGRREFRPAEQFHLIGGKEPGWAGMCRVGKKAAGRLLDGVEHSEFPKVPA